MERRGGEREERERSERGERERRERGDEEGRRGEPGEEGEREKEREKRGEIEADRVYTLLWYFACFKFGKRCSPSCTPSCPHSSQASVAHALLSGQSNWQLSQMQGGWYGEQPMRGGGGRKCRYIYVPIHLSLTISGCLMCGNRCLALSR